MIRFICLIGALLYCISSTFAANPAIIFGSGGRALTIPSNGIELSSGVIWYDLPADPTISATDAPQGSFGAFGANLYVKQDAGSTTNWTAVSLGVAASSPLTTRGDILTRDASVEIRLPIGTNGQSLVSDGVDVFWGTVSGLTPLMSKGSLFASDGVTNGEFTSCADGESMEYDSAETTGFKCVVGGTALMLKGSLLASDGVNNTEKTACGDGEILEYDAAEALGFKCVVKPLELALLSKGSIVTSNGTVNGEQLACSDGEILEYDAATATGIKCATPATATSLTTKGDLQTFDTANQRLAVGTDGQNLVADSTEPTGIKWIDELILGLGVLGKGSILTSDGVDNGEFTACADDEILVWDSVEAAGVKCEAKPVASAGVSIYFSANQSPTPYSNGTASFTNIGLTLAGVVVPTGGTVELNLADNDAAFDSFAQNGNCIYQWMRNGVDVGFGHARETSNTEYISPSIAQYDTPAAGTYTYTIKARQFNIVDFDCILFKQKIVAKVFP